MIVIVKELNFLFLKKNYCRIERLTFIKTKYKNKKYFCKWCLQCFSSEKILTEHKENWSIINGKQSVNLKSDSISFKNYFKQLPLPFKI